MRADLEREYVEFVSAHLHRWHRQAYLLAGDGHGADDIVSQTCVNLFVHWRRVRAADSIDRYAHQVLVKTFLNERRRGWWTRVRVSGEVPDRPVPVLGEPEDRPVLWQALLCVPPRQRAAIVLRYLYDLPVAEVADLLGCSTGTVKSQCARGLATMRQLLGEAAVLDSAG